MIEISDDLRIGGPTVLERLHELPGGPELLELAAARAGVELVGGATRDLLLGLAPRELDVVVADDAPSFAAALAPRLGVPGMATSDGHSSTTLYERFGTALVIWDGGRVDIAERRAESYRRPGALPDVSSGTPEQDLLRRDFTVNAIAVSLGGVNKGELRAVPNALEDLAASRLRVLHDRSFRDDPTRLLRLARYRARLRFEPEAQTAKLAREAVGRGALSTISGARVGAELRLALAEADPIGALRALAELGALSAIDKRLRLNEPFARAALALLPQEGRRDLLLLGCLLASVAVATRKDPEPALRALLDRLEFKAADRDHVLKSVLLAPPLLGDLAQARSPSQIREATRACTLETVALAGALAGAQQMPDAAGAARRWLAELRHVTLSITGDDLLAAGVASGPEVGRRLELALSRKLDRGLPDDPETELATALEGP